MHSQFWVYSALSSKYVESEIGYRFFFLPFWSEKGESILGVITEVGQKMICFSLKLRFSVSL